MPWPSVIVSRAPTWLSVRSTKLSNDESVGEGCDERTSAHHGSAADDSSHAAWSVRFEPAVAQSIALRRAVCRRGFIRAGGPARRLALHHPWLRGAVATRRHLG